MKRRLDKENFFSLFGLQESLADFTKSNDSIKTVVSSDLEAGALRALQLKLSKKRNSYTVGLEYLFHEDMKHNSVEKFLQMEVHEEGDEVVIENAHLEGQKLDIEKGEVLFALSKAFKAFSDHIVHKNEWVNPIGLLKKSGLVHDSIGRRAWPGLYVSGDRKGLTSAVNKRTHDNIYPASFLGAILGVGPEHHADAKKKTRSLVMSSYDYDRQSYTLKYDYERGGTPKNIKVKGTLAKYGNEGKQSETLYEVETKSIRADVRYAQIARLEYMGHEIDLSDQRAVVNVLKNIRNINRSIRAGDQALIDDLKKSPYDRRYALASEMMLYSNTYDHLHDNTPIPEEGIMTFSAVGGNNHRKYVSDYDQHIGGNQYVLSYQKQDKNGEKHNSALMIDGGVQFHDIFSLVFYNPSDYLEHKYDKRKKPEVDLKAIFVTHQHVDHVGQLSYLVKCGYELPALVMDKMSLNQFKKDMQEIGVDRDVRDEILSQCYILDLNKDVNPSAPHEVKETLVGKTRIEQWTEVVEDEQDANKKHFYPRLKIGDFELRVGPMPHSSPGMMVDVITKAGSHRHTGDFKMDSTILVENPRLEPWLKAHSPDSLSIDSTNIKRTGKTPPEEKVGESITRVINENPNKRLIFPMLGSNLARLYTVVSGMGQSDCKKLIVDGHAVEHLVKTANKVHDFKKWAKDEHGVDVLIRSYKEAKELLNTGEPGDYAILTTGSQDEFLSSMNRAARDWLPPERYSLTEDDVIIPLQGTIPVGMNYMRRKGLAYVVKNFFGATVMMPEKVKEEGDYYFKSSGHASQDDVKEMITLSGKPHVIPMHGGPDQLDKNAEFARNLGAQATVLGPSVAARIEKGKKVSIFKNYPAEYVGIRPHTWAKEKFYLRGQFSTCVIPVGPVPNSPVKKLLHDFENAARHFAGINNDLEVAKSLPVSLSRHFNTVASNGYLAQDIPFGIEKHKGSNIFKSKNIFAIGAFDTETGGLNANDALIREFGMTIESVDREPLENVQLFQKIPEYRLPSPAAMLVTNTRKGDLRSGLPAHKFVSRMNKSLKDLVNHSVNVALERGLILSKRDAKALSIAHNTRFDSMFIQKEGGRNLQVDKRPHQTRGVIALDTRTISRALGAYFPDKYKVNMNPETGLPDHRLESLCKANGVSYDEDQGHGALYDTKPALDLFWKQYEISPDLVGQMIYNADATRSHLLNDMMGMETGFGGPQPVFSYVSQSALKPKPQMGCFIGTLDTKKQVILFNLKYDPEKYLTLPTADILDMMKDRKNDVFEVIDLRKQPIIMPARFGFRVRANGSVPKELIDRRAGAVRRHLNYIDPRSDWKTIAQKIEMASIEDKKKIYGAYKPSGLPDLDSIMTMNRETGPTPEDGVYTLALMHAKLGFNPVYKTIVAKVREYIKAVEHSDMENDDNLLKAEASRIYKSLMKDRKQLDKALLTINNVHYDINPDDLSVSDRRDVELMRHNMFCRLHRQGMEEIHAIEANKDGQKDKLIGDDADKKKQFEELKAWYQSMASRAKLTKEGQDLIRPWRKYTRAANDNNPPSSSADNKLNKNNRRNNRRGGQKPGGPSL